LLSPFDLILTVTPTLGLVVRQSDRHQEHARASDQQQQPDEIQLPEQRHRPFLPRQVLDDGDRRVGVRVGLFYVGSLPLSRTGSQRGDDGDRHDGGDDREHACVVEVVVSAISG
jgi:hypothetical protein